MGTNSSIISLLLMMIITATPSFALAENKECEEILTPDRVTHYTLKAQKYLTSPEPIFNFVGGRSALIIIERGEPAEVLTLFANDLLIRLVKDFDLDFYFEIATELDPLPAKAPEYFLLRAGRMSRLHTCLKVMAAMEKFFQKNKELQNSGLKKLRRDFVAARKVILTRTLDWDDANDLAADLALDFAMAQSPTRSPPFLVRQAEVRYQQYLKDTDPAQFEEIIPEIIALLSVHRYILVEFQKQTGRNMSKELQQLEALKTKVIQFLTEDRQFLKKERQEVNQILEGIRGLEKPIPDFTDPQMYWSMLEGKLAHTANYLRRVKELPQILQRGIIIKSSSTPGQSAQEKTDILRERYEDALEHIKGKFVADLFDAINRNDLPAVQKLSQTQLVKLSKIKTGEGESPIAVANSMEMMKLLHSFLYP
jgi:hypothetical protein